MFRNIGNLFSIKGIMNLRWYYVVPFLLGGFVVMGAIYFVLRASGLLYKLTTDENDWQDSGE